MVQLLYGDRLGAQAPLMVAAAIFDSTGQKVLLALTFAAEVAAGQPAASDETTVWGWFAPADFDSLDIMERHRLRLADIFALQPEAFLR